MNYAKTVNKQDFADAAVLTFGESVIVNVIHVSSHLDSLAKGTFFFSQSFTHTIDFDIFFFLCGVKATTGAVKPLSLAVS